MVDLSALGAQTGGVWTRREALTLLTPGAVRASLRDGRWQVPWPGVHAGAGADLSAEQRCWAAVVAGGGSAQPQPWGLPDARTGQRPLRPQAVACGRTAARYWGIPLVDDDDPATSANGHLHDDVSIWSHHADLGHNGRVLHRRRLKLSVEDVVLTDTGLHVTSPLRTLVDCAGLLNIQALVCALDGALHKSLVSPAELATAVTSRSGLRDGAVLARAVALADGRAETPFETLTRLLILPAVPTLEPQVELRDGHGQLIARFDLGDRARRFAVESDGKQGHSGEEMVAKDRRRDRRTEHLGWTTERVTWFEVRCRQPETVAWIRERVAKLDRRPPS